MTTDLIPNPITYVDGAKVSGTLSFESIKIGAYPVLQFPFLETNDYTTIPPQSYSSFDGTLGLLYKTKKTYPDGSVIKSLIQTLFEQSPLLSKLFSVVIYEGEQAGEWVIGGFNSARLLSEIAFIPIQPNPTKPNTLHTWWQSNLKQVSTNKESIDTAVNIIVDTGTSFTYLPTQAASFINQALGFIKKEVRQSVSIFLYLFSLLNTYFRSLKRIHAGGCLVLN